MKNVQPAPVPHLVFGLDRSGSMIACPGGDYSRPKADRKSKLLRSSYYKHSDSRASLIEDAYKSFVEDQLKLALPAIVSVYAHDDSLHPLVVRKPLVDAASVTIDPFGGNCMYELFMRLIDKHKNDESVMLIWMVDGDDIFYPENIRAMKAAVKLYTETKGWFFAYVGVGGVAPGSRGCATTFGISEENAIYAADGAKNVAEAAVRLSQMATAFRTGMGV